ncbi:MAG: hypothetical protein F6K47_37340 [Symploca sp. SIO2E6]|nr:hypothetical protein [Symploca sp. SIO2E6]
MCIALLPVDFSKTLAAIHEFTREGMLYHLGLYANSVRPFNETLLSYSRQQSRNLATAMSGSTTILAEPSFQTGSRNAMVLTIPVKQGYQMSRDNIVLFDGDPLKTMKEAYEAKLAEGMRGSRGFRSKSLSFSPYIDIFEVGAYTVCLTNSLYNLDHILSEWDITGVASASQELLDSFDSAVPSGYTYLVAIFNPEAGVEFTSQTIGWYYPPANQDLLVIPGLDCHTGKHFSVEDLVARDHLLFFSSEELTEEHGGISISYDSGFSEGQLQYLPKRVKAVKVSQQTRNGDFVLSRKTLFADDSFQLGQEQLRYEVVNL